MAEFARLVDDYFALEPRLIDHARAVFGNTMKGYFGMAETAELKVSNMPTPSLSFVYSRDTFQNVGNNQQAHSTQQIVGQVWTIWVAVQNHSHKREADPRRGEAGPYVSQIIKAFSGWPALPTGPASLRNVDDFFPLRRVAPPRGPIYTPVSILVPISFEARLTTHSM